MMIDILWVLLSAGLVFLMQAGFLCRESGLTRLKNSINVAIKYITTLGVSILLYWAVGFAIMFGNSFGGWAGHNLFFLPIHSARPWIAAFFIFQVMSCATAVAIISGAVAERMKFTAYVMAIVVVSGFIYPLFGHWAWGGLLQNQQSQQSGWLQTIGFVDFAGSTVVHSLGAWAALALVITLGPRIGRFPTEKKTHGIPGNNIPMAMLGTLLLWFGWIGFNGGRTFAMNASVGGIIINTLLSASAGLITALLIGWKKAGYPDAQCPMMGSLSGLVAITASCHAVSPLSSIIIGSIGAVIMLLITDLLEKFKVDDVVGAIPVHVGAGVWGTLAPALFGTLEILNTGLSRFQQFGAQLLGIIACFVIAFLLPLLIFSIFDRFFSLRISPNDENQGLNVADHHATTELLDLYRVMEQQEETQDFSIRAPVEPFTEVGQIAQRYNAVLDILQKSLQHHSRAIIRNVRDGIFTVSKDGLLTSFNPAGEAMFGYSASEILFRPATLLLSSRHYQSYLQTEPLNDSSGVFVKIAEKFKELMGQRKNSSTFPMEVSVNYDDTAEDVSAFTVSVRDITERKKVEEDLRSSREQSRSIIETANDAFVSTNSQSIILDWNRQAELTFGWKREEIIGQRLYDTILPGESCDDQNAGLKGFLHSGQNHTLDKRVELTARHKDGHEFPIEITIWAFKKEGTSVFNAFIRDITDMKKAEQERKKLEQQLLQAQKLESIGTLAAGIAHEINTPIQFISDNTCFVKDSISSLIAMIGSYKETLYHEPSSPEKDQLKALLSDLEKKYDIPFLEEEIPEALSQTQEGLDRVTNIVKAMRDFSHVGADDDKAPADINKAVESTIVVSRNTWKYVADIRTDLNANLPMVSCYLGEIKQVLLNLIVNASHAIMEKTAKQGSPPGVITIKTYATKSAVFISISDTGTGIPLEIQKRIFDPFFTTKEVGKGTGQGLSMAYHTIVEKHEGKLTFETVPNQGSTFIIELPLGESDGKKTGTPGGR